MVELLAPAGNKESLAAAIKAGADAVYFGVKELNMRSLGSKNFELEELPKIVEQCHKKKVKTYLTVNSIVYDNETIKVDQLLKAAKKAKVDAIIASDFAVIQKANELGIPLHISTQCSVSNYDSLKFYAKFADNVVLARELTLKQIKNITTKIKKEKLKGVSGKEMKIECFCHGAMCISVSGRCFMSLFEYNKSANRGECLQSCRRAYKVTDLEEKKELKIENNYVMSPNDLCTIEILDKLVDAGIDIFKIEGRARSPEYVFTVTKAYRNALDAIEKSKFTEKLKKELFDSLKTVYNRGFSTGFFMGMPMGKWSGQYGSKATEKKVYVGKVTHYYPKPQVAEIKLEAGGINKGDEIAFTGPTTGFFRQKLEEMQVNHKPVAKLAKGNSVGIKVNERVRSNDKFFVIKGK
ncbi:MAG: peptidase U32 family protein [Candidatus Woesearchaeota archaeon]|nr:peptidase U32 family protein [Candidatus Woesearchaeota archaeon]